jgi:zinc transport system substrate-binding protein
VQRTSLTRLVAVALVPVAVGGVLAGCGDDDPGGGAVSVVASFYPVAEVAERVGGDRVDVSNLTPAGTEPHDLELTPDQVADVEDADVVLYLGEGFQPALSEIAGRRDEGSFDLLEEIPLEAGAADALEEETDVDPHFWLDPQLMITAVDEVEAALSEVSPDDAATFAANAEEYKDELTALDDELATGLGSCERDQIVTSHAAFHYLAKRYGLTQLPITGLSPEAEPDPARLAELADQIESEGITTVFYETLVSPDVAETLAREADVEAAVLNPIEGLTQEQIDAGDDYASVMRDNLAALQEALGCS